MAWKTIDRITSPTPEGAEPVLSEAVRAKIRSFFPRYETKRAVLLPALHVVQDALGCISYQAMAEIAEVLEITPSSVLDTVTFYSHYWTHHRGEKVIVVCRSVSCMLMGGDQVFEAIRDKLQIGEHDTTPDGKYSLMTEECLAGCDFAPCMLINEKLHKNVKPQDVAAILADENNAKIDHPRSDLYDAPPAPEPEAAADESAEGAANGDGADDGIENTSDVAEMESAD